MRDFPLLMLFFVAFLLATLCISLSITSEAQHGEILVLKQKIVTLEEVVENQNHALNLYEDQRLNRR